MSENNRLILIGNGFDLAHGLKTSYKDFLDWYMCDAFQKFHKENYYQDSLIEIKCNYSRITRPFDTKPKDFNEVLNLLLNNDQVSIKFNSNFFDRLLKSHNQNSWVDIELFYFKFFKSYFSNPNVDTRTVVSKLNADFDFLITKLSEYIRYVNENLSVITKLPIDNPRIILKNAFAATENSLVKFLNFNYTETLFAKYHIDQEEIIHIHGRAADIEKNPIIFGYGDESDPVYQQIEDSGENLYLQHIKSFGYFRTNNYDRLLSYIDSGPYDVYVVGHSCGLSDRVLLNEIFEHKYCGNIKICYHERNDGSDNFKEITQEISRHFRPQNKNIMRRRVNNKDARNIIPQNKI